MAWKQDSNLPVLGLRENPSGQALLLTTMALLAIGVITVNSAMARPVTRAVEWYSRTDFRHTVYAVISLLVLMTAWRFDYHRLDGKRVPYLAMILFGLAMLSACLLYVPGLATTEAGFARWLKIGPKKFNFGFQPSGLVMFSMLILLSAWLARPGVKVRSFFRTFVPAMLVIGLAVGATVAEDFSIGAVLGMAGCATLLFAGVPWYYLLTLIPPAAGGFYKLVYTNDYRWNRIVAWMDPWSDKNPCTYQARESLVSILSGGWTGKGLGLGTVKLGYMPEGSSDFVFSVYCEEWGFVGALLLIGLIFLWIWITRRAALRAGDKLGQLLIASLGFLIAVQAVIHIAVALAVAPTTGMGLPFVSVGGTSLVMSAAAVALMISVTARSPRTELSAEDHPQITQINAESNNSKLTYPIAK